MIKKEVTKMTGTNKGSSGKRIAIVTFGWPMGAVLYDHRTLFEQDLVNL